MRLPVSFAGLWLGGFVLTPGVYHLFLAGYFAALWALRLWLFPAGSADDAEALFFAQSFELGYKPGQPPLYSWLVWLAEQVFGASLGLVVAIKYAFLWATHALAFELARQITGSARWGAFAGLSVFGLYYLAWDAALNYSQTVLIAALAMATVLMARTTLARGSFDAAALLGLVIGVGLATKYNFALFALAVVGAMALDARGRVLLGGGGALFLVAPALAVPAPHVYWLVSGQLGGGDLAAAMPAMAMADGGFDWRAAVDVRLAGLLDVGEAVLSILMPFLALWIAFFPRALRRIGRAAGDAVIADLHLIERILGLFVLAAVLLVAVAGMSEVRNHWFIVIAPFVAYATLRTAVVYGDSDAHRTRGYAGVMALLALFVVTGLGARSAVETASCDKCKMVVPYGRLAAALSAAGFEGGTVWTVDQPVQIAGNLRAHLPSPRYESQYFASYEPPENVFPGACLAVWLEGNPSSPSAETVAGQLVRRFGAAGLDPLDDLRHAEIRIGPGNVQSYGFFLIDDRDRQGRCF